MAVCVWNNIYKYFQFSPQATIGAKHLKIMEHQGEVEDNSQPSFTVVKTTEFNEWSVFIEIYVNSLSNVWFLAKMVQLYKDHERRKGKIKEEVEMISRIIKNQQNDTK